MPRSSHSTLLRGHIDSRRRLRRNERGCSQDPDNRSGDEPSYDLDVQITFSGIPTRTLRASKLPRVKTYHLRIGQSLIGLEQVSDGSSNSSPSVVPAQFSSRILAAWTTEIAYSPDSEPGLTETPYDIETVTYRMAEAYARGGSNRGQAIHGADAALGYWANEHEQRADKILRAVQNRAARASNAAVGFGDSGVPDMLWSATVLTAFNMHRLGETEARWPVSDLITPIGGVQISLDRLSDGDSAADWPIATITATRRGQAASADTADTTIWGPIVTKQTSSVTISAFEAEKALHPAKKAHLSALEASASLVTRRARSLGIRLDVQVEPLSQADFWTFIGLQGVEAREERQAR